MPICSPREEPITFQATVLYSNKYLICVYANNPFSLTNAQMILLTQLFPYPFCVCINRQSLSNKFRKQLSSIWMLSTCWSLEFSSYPAIGILRRSCHSKQQNFFKWSPPEICLNDLLCSLSFVCNPPDFTTPFFSVEKKKLSKRNRWNRSSQLGKKIKVQSQSWPKIPNQDLA